LSLAARARRLLGPPAIFPHHQENDLVTAFFRDSGPGYFVEVGANEPQNLSQTWHLERAGWSGVLIEPQPALAQALREQRTAKVYQCACSSPRNSGATLTLHLSGIHSSLDADFFVEGTTVSGAITVPVRTLDEILAEARATPPLDFVSIDVEGHELEVLAGFDLARWRPRLILIEDLAMTTRVHRTLSARGYRWIRRSGINGWYVPAQGADAPGLRGRWQFFRKYYAGTPFRRLREFKRRLRARLRAAAD
jgi:FkbM family methyltransferase